VLELFRPENKSQVLKRIWVDSVTYLPVRWDDYDFKDPSASTWRNIKSNVGLSDDLFSL
jgi:outer membrane lipoprotein-sorting protein